MIPLASQIQSRAGPAITAAAHAGDPIGAPVAQTRSDIPPVEQASATSEDMQPGRDGVGHAARAEPGAGRRLPSSRHSADESTGPQDRALFRARVIRFLSDVYGDDAAFLRAVEAGTITVRAVADQPEPEMRPELTYAIYREGVAQAEAEWLQRRAGGLPISVGPNDFIAWWPK